MKKIVLLILLFSSVLWAQEKMLKGTVFDFDGQPLPDANVEIIGGNSISTDEKGNYSIQVKEGDKIIFSFLGFVEQTFIVDQQTTLNVTLSQNEHNKIGEVIVTALGIKKEKKALTYSAQDVKGEELTRIKDTNPINALSGKVSGLTINRSTSGAGGSVKVLLRGNTSIGNNQPLYVIDGIPFLNNSPTQPNNTFGDINSGNRDGGDALSLINPDDIESISVLKGASASALYGSSGQNGVIVITTKKGKEGAFRVNVSSSTTANFPAYKLKVRDDLKHNVDDFFQTGVTNINGITISGGTNKAQTYFSYANTNGRGVIPENNLIRHNLNFKETAKLFNDKLKIDANVILSTQKIRNKPISGFYYNPLVGVYQYDEENGNLSDYKNFEDERGVQQWWRATSDTEQNPYWILNRNATLDRNEKLFTSVTLSYKATPWLTLQARGSVDRAKNTYERKSYDSTNATLAPAGGRYVYNDLEDQQLYADFMATIDRDLTKDIKLNANLGATARTIKEGDGILLDSGINGGLRQRNVFSLQNFIPSLSASLSQDLASREQRQSLFVATQFGYKNMIYLDATARQEFSSTLAFTSNKGYFFPSVGLTTILSEILDFGHQISFAKVRASYAEVGSPIKAFSTNVGFKLATGGILNPSAAIFPSGELKPQRQKSFELGTTWRFLKNRIGLDATYYKTNTKDQYFIISVPVTTGHAQSAFNAGDIQNQGVEVTFTSTPIKGTYFQWNSDINYAVNDNRIKKLSDKISGGLYTLTDAGVNSYASYIREGGSYGEIWGKKVARNANGLPILNDAGTPVIEDFSYLGIATPKWTLGWNNTFKYKNFDLNFLIDGRFGGVAMSMTQAVVDQAGNSNRAADSDTMIDAVTVTTAADGTTTEEIKEISSDKYYRSIGGRNGATAEYTYDATNIRLAEVSLSYKFNLSKKGFFHSVKASLIGRNLFFFYKDAPYDPNVTLSTGNGLQGLDVFGSPSTRSLGLNIQLSF